MSPCFYCFDVRACAYLNNYTDLDKNILAFYRKKVANIENPLFFLLAHKNANIKYVKHHENP